MTVCARLFGLPHSKTGSRFERQQRSRALKTVSVSSMAMDCSPSSTFRMVERVREAGPLIQCITNFVSMDIMANTLLASGASPAMAHSLEEVEDFIGISSGLLVNMGTLDPEWIASMKLCSRRARDLGKPWVLDPVGAGATPYRTAAVRSLVGCRPSVIRGNAGEISALAGATGTVKGVDAAGVESESCLDIARELARTHGCIVAVSGAVDVITDGTRVARVANGTPMLTKITAAGCSLTALIAAYCTALPEDHFVATAHAMAVFGLAAELAEEKAAVKGPGSVRTGLLDQLYLLDEATVCERARVSLDP